MSETWSDLQERFRHEVLVRGVFNVAKQMRVHPATIYRLINGSTKRPCHRTRKSVAKLILEGKQSAV